MINILRRMGLGSIAAWMICLPAAHAGDVDVAASLYGQGVHAYFAGRPGEAEPLLSRALAIQTDDPRVFYFRALSRLQLGRLDEARSDMSLGAGIEAQRPNRYAVGAALVRVQGGDRLLLERYRRQARAQVDQMRDRAQGEPHQQITVPASSVLRQPVVVPLEEFLQPGVPRALTAEELALRAAGAARAPVPAAKPAVVAKPLQAAPAEPPVREEAAQPAAETPSPPAPEPTAPAGTSPPDEEDPFFDIQ